MSDTLTLAPMLPWPVIAVLAAAALALVVLSLVRGGRGTVLRAVVLAVLLVALVNPQAVREERQPQHDIAIVVVDRSASQSVGQRREQTAAALAFAWPSLRANKLAPMTPPEMRGSLAWLCALFTRIQNEISKRVG